MARRIREHNWALTPLGVVDNWPQGLQSTVDMLVAHGFPMVALWGPDLIQLYNDGYRALMGIKHPEGLGQPTRECWPEVWHINAPIYDRVLRGETLTFEDSLYPITRSGRLEDAWFTLSYSPLRDDTGAIAGVLVTVTKTTDRVEESARRDAAEAALHAREERFRAFVTASADVVYRMSPDWSQMWQLDGAGFLADTAEADEDWRKKYILPADRERVEAAIRRAIGAKAMFELEHPVIRADGTPGWTLSRAVPILGTDGEIVEWLGAAKDVTERKRADLALLQSEERQAFLLKLSDAVRPIDDPVEIQGEAARLLGEHLDAGGCNYVEVDAEAGDWVIHRDYRRDGLPSIAGRFRREEWPLFGEDFLRGEPMSIPDIGEYPLILPEERAATQALGLVALIIAPITKRGRFMGGMAVTDSKPRAWTPDDMALVVEVAERTWAAVERGRAAEALRESEALSRIALDSGRMGAWRWDLRSGLIRGDPVFLALYGLPPTEDLLSLPAFTERMSSESQEQIAAVVAKAIEAGEEFEGDIEIVAGATAARWVRWRGRPAVGDTSVLHGVTYDITEQTQADIDLRESERQHAFLLALTDALRPLTDARQVVARATQMLGDYMQADRCFVAEMDPDGVNLDVHEEHLRPGASSVIGHHNFDSFGVFVSPVLVRGDILAVEDIATLDLTEAERAHYAAIGIAAYLLVPLVRDGWFAACFAVNHETPHRWSKGDKDIARQVADRTWAAVERARAEAALRTSEQRLQRVLETDAVAVLFFSTEGVLIGANDVFLRMTGYSRAEVEAGTMTWRDMTPPEYVAESQAQMDQFAETGRIGPYEKEYLRKDGSRSWLLFAGRDLGDGTIVEFGVDIGDRKRAEAALRESEERFREFGENSSDALWIVDVETMRLEYLSPAFERIWGESRDAVVADVGRWAELVHPEDRAAAAAAMPRLLAGEPYVADYRIVRPDGEIRWIRDTGFPIKADGVVKRGGGIAQDVTNLKRAQERQKVLLAELQHRVRNTLAVIRSMVSRFGDGDRSTEDYVQHLQGRISALARTQVLLTRSAGAGVDLEDMIRDELVAQVANDDQFSLDGPDIELSPKAAEVLTLAIHELATNATKYGAFSRAAGRLKIEWDIEAREGQKWLVLNWTECGVPIIDAAPRRQGFGSELISRRIPYELKGTGSFALKPGGLESHIEFPLLPGDSILQTSGVA